MAIEPVKKIRVIVHQSLRDEVVDALQVAGTVHIERLTEEDLLPAGESGEKEVAEVRRCTFGISKAEFLLGFFKEYGYERPGFFKTLIKEKYPMTREAFNRAGERVDLDMAYAECSELDRWLTAIDEEKSRLEQEAGELADWTELQLDLDEMDGRHTYGLMPVRIVSGEIKDVVLELSGEVPESTLDVVCERDDWACCMVVYHPDSLEGVESVLDRHRHEAVTLPSYPLEPAERLEQVEREMASLDRRREKFVAGASAYAEKRREIEVLREYLLNERRKIQLSSEFGETRSTAVIDGWVTESALEATVASVQGVSDDIEIELFDPTGEDNPPVSLKNGKWARPFQLLTGLYGIPHNREYDPTLIIAISFVVFFGFCIGDVGYGLVLIGAFLLMRRLLPLGQKVKDLLLVMTYGSAFAIVAGVITGSWFGIDPEKLPPFLQSLAVLDPLRKPIPVMGLMMALGVVHMLSGTVIEFRDNIKGRDWAAAFIDQGLVFLFLIGLGVGIPLMLAKVVPKSVALLIAGFPVILMLLLLGRAAKSIPGKAVGGLYETYNTVVGWVGDTISYMRLYALGLATFVIGWVVNTLAGMVQGTGPVIGILLMLLVLVLGHTFNVTINLLGAFVHPLRLEFVEFFGKFYEDGGHEFSPMKVESKIVLIDEEGA